MSNFISAGDNSRAEREDRKGKLAKRLLFGVDYLDDATQGIWQSDLVLLGAPSGVGKTQLCCSIALTNLNDSRRVHYIGLEAEQYEIERRLKYPIVAGAFFSDPERPKIDMSFDSWYLGQYMAELSKYEDVGDEIFESYKDLYVFYKQDKFDIADLIEQVTFNADATDLIIIDHVHYFDFDDDNENRAMKQIAKTVRRLALDEGKPILLVAHLRKKDRFADYLCAGLEDFMGSSDLYKIATKCVTMGPGQMSDEGNFETFFRVAKNRFNGGATRFCGRVFYDPKQGTYKKQYKVGHADQSRKEGFAELDHRLYPRWARRPTGIGGDSVSDTERQSSFAELSGGQESVKTSPPAAYKD